MWLTLIYRSNCLFREPEIHRGPSVWDVLFLPRHGSGASISSVFPQIWAPRVASHQTLNPDMDTVPMTASPSSAFFTETPPMMKRGAAGRGRLLRSERPLLRRRPRLVVPGARTSTRRAAPGAAVLRLPAHRPPRLPSVLSSPHSTAPGSLGTLIALN